VTSSQQGTYCYVVKPDTTVELRPVTVQRSWRELAVIAAGVKAGETVVTDGQLRLSPGARAVIRSEPGNGGAGVAGGAGGPGAGNAGGKRAAATEGRTSGGNR